MRSPLNLLLIALTGTLLFFAGTPDAAAQYEEEVTDNPPVILQPADEDVVRCLFNMVWTPSPYFSFYQVIIYPLRDGMSPAQAVRVEHPAFEQQVSGNTALLQEDVSLPDGEYVLVVCVPEFGLCSEPVAFTYCCGNFATGPCAGQWEEEEEETGEPAETIVKEPKPRNDVVYAWEEDVEEIVEYYSQLDLLTMEDDCEDISRKLRELMDLIMDLNLEFVETEADIEEMLQDIADATDAIDQAKKDKADAAAAKADIEERCERHERQQNDIFELILEACGGTPGVNTPTGVDCPPDFQADNASYAAVGATPNLPLGAGNVACMPGTRVDDFLNAMDTWRDNLKNLDEKARDCRKEAQKEQDKIDVADALIEDFEDLIDDLTEDIADAEDRLEEIDAELDALYEAIEELFALDDICPVVIAQLKEEFAEAQAHYWELTEIVFEQNQVDMMDTVSMGNGNDPLAQDLFDEASEILDSIGTILEGGTSDGTDSLLHVADSLVHLGLDINNLRDCLQQIKLYLDLLGSEVVKAKNKFPNSDFSDAVDRINRWRERWDEAKEALDNGDIKKAKILCRTIRVNVKAEGSYYPLTLYHIYEMIISITCNEGDFRDGPEYRETRRLGTIVVPHGHDVDEYVGGGSLADFMEANTREQGYVEEIGEVMQGTLDYTKLAVDYNKVDKIIDIFIVEAHINCQTREECVRGEWVTREYVDCSYRVTHREIGSLIKPNRDIFPIDDFNDDLRRMIERYADIKTEFGDPPPE